LEEQEAWSFLDDDGDGDDNEDGDGNVEKRNAEERNAENGHEEVAPERFSSLVGGDGELLVVE